MMVKRTLGVGPTECIMLGVLNPATLKGATGRSARHLKMGLEATRKEGPQRIAAHTAMAK